MTKIVESLKQNGEEVTEEDLGYVVPLMRKHVIPNGTYFNNTTNSQPAISIWES